MAKLSNSEIDLLQTYQDRIAASFQEDGLCLDTEQSLLRWTTVVRTKYPNAYITPALDPSRVTLAPPWSFGLFLSDHGHLVAYTAARSLITDGFPKEIATMRFWCEKAPETYGELDCMVVPRDLPRIAGKVAHEGALWVDPNYRRRGIAARLSRFVRAAAARRWMLDWITGIARPEVAGPGIPQKSYGYDHMVPLVDGYIPLGNNERDVLYLCYMSISELLAQVRNELALQYAAQ